ncbi:MAG: hypothetical protein JW919_03665 [Candidatus Omnitrophica bacterium]|nr:hypothetical protein [Candidatus Omnitrophota bacterium]
MIIKKKSLIVALVSSFVIALVLVLTLVGYVIYLEIHERNVQHAYQELLAKVNARVYARYLEISRLAARIDNAGPLKGNPVVEGLIKNAGTRNVTDLMLKIKFLDRNGATIYETAFAPQEPPLGGIDFSQVSIPYFNSAPRVIISAGGSLAFKRVLSNCPPEILSALRDRKNLRKDSRWTNALAYEILAVDF